MSAEARAERDEARRSSFTLVGVRLEFRLYRAPSPEWDHDHCTFCWAEFAELDRPPNLHYGYTTCRDYIHGSGYAWICLNCFERRRNLFEWIIGGHSPERVRRYQQWEPRELTPLKTKPKGWIQRPRT